MTTPALDPKTVFPNHDNFWWKMPSDGEIGLRIKQLKRELHDDRIILNRLFIGAACLSFFPGIILFATWFTWL